MWELFLDTPGDELKIRFPNDHRSTKHISYNRKPLDHKHKREILQKDGSYKSKTGEPVNYYVDDLNNEFVLYPRPTNANWLDGDGMALFATGDTLSQETGVMLRRYDTTLSQDGGLAVDIVDADYNVILFYERNTTDLENTNQTSDFPLYLRKYIEYGVIAKAYGANTDGRIKSLGEFWDARFELGISAIKKMQVRKYADRNYFLRTQGAHRYTRSSRPRLPSTYADNF